jgi:hypothetical protein
VTRKGFQGVSLTGKSNNRGISGGFGKIYAVDCAVKLRQSNRLDSFLERLYKFCRALRLNQLLDIVVLERFFFHPR